MSKHGNFESCRDVLPKPTRRNFRQVVMCNCGKFYVCDGSWGEFYWWTKIKIKVEKTNFETYLEEQLKNPQVKEAFDGREQMMLTYTYPDGSGNGGTFTDGDQFSQESIQTIIDNVIAHVQSDERNRAMRIVSKQLGETEDAGVITYLINDVNVL